MVKIKNNRGNGKTLLEIMGYTETPIPRCNGCLYCVKGITSHLCIRYAGLGVNPPVKAEGRCRFWEGAKPLEEEE